MDYVLIILFLKSDLAMAIIRNQANFIQSTNEPAVGGLNISYNLNDLAPF